MWNIVLILFIFIVVLAIVIMADNMTTALLVISLLTNFLIIYKIIKKSIVGGKSESADDIDKDEQIDFTTSDSLDTNTSIEPLDVNILNEGYIYGAENQEYEIYKGYNRRPISNIYESAGSVEGVDARNIKINQLRGQRNKDTIESIASKTSDYFKYHFEEELKNEEAKRWWGNNEY